MSEKWRILTNPSKKELDPHRIEIECIDPPGKEGEGDGKGYIVVVCPSTKQNKPGKTQKSPPYIYTEPIKKVFATKEEVVAYISKVL